MKQFDEMLASFENSNSEQFKKQTGVVYTPPFVVKYILDKTLTSLSVDTKIIDPACGGGIFILYAIEYLRHVTGKAIDEIIANNVYGIDNDPNAVALAHEVLTQYSQVACGKKPSKINIYHGDSTDIEFLSSLGKFDYVVGNPPYVRIQNIPEDKRQYLKSWSMVNGDSDLYIAFIELAFFLLKSDGRLGFITPNSYLKNKSTINLLNWLIDNRKIVELIDFEGYQIFGKKATTYTSILIASNEEQKSMTMRKLTGMDENLDKVLSTDVKSYEVVKSKSILIPSNKINRLNKFENVGTKLKNLVKIKVGLATLADSIFYTDTDLELVKPCVKVSKIKNQSDIVKHTKSVIYPYQIVNGKAVPYSEQELSQFPKTYEYLLSRKEELMKRDRGKIALWYTYGRTQGLTSLFGRKMLMPPMIQDAKFVISEDPDLLYLSGYAIFGDRLEMLKIVLESDIFNEYIALTAKDFRGGWKACTKHGIENFSIPDIDDNEMDELKNDTNAFLNRKYGLT
jgi:tRNA1(Val) A37 N6-methylase TrmN6